MKLIEIIVHVYAEEFPAFASLLTAQLSSLVLWQPQRCNVLVTVCGTPGDVLAFNTCTLLHERLRPLPQASLRWVPFDKAHLFRRGCARNMIAKTTGANVVWFADADYLFGPGCLDALAEARLPGTLEVGQPRCVFPRQYQVHRSHAMGDAEIARIVPGQVFTPDLTLFEPCKLSFAIGGLQIVSGDWAARNGYLDGTKWSQPVPDATRFLDTKEDKHYRAACGGSSPIDLPNLYRLRHSSSSFESPEKRLAQTAGKV